MIDISAIVLAAGEGKRMKPLGSNLPKVMLPVLGKPVLDYVISNLTEAQIKKIVIVVSRASEPAIKKYFGANFKGIEIEYVIQQKQLGPAQAIALALSIVKTEYFLVQYGDSLADINIPENLVLELSQNPDIDGVLAIREVDDPSRYGMIKYQGNRVVDIDEKRQGKPPSNHATIGSFILNTNQYMQAIKNTKFQYGKEEFPAHYVLRGGAKIITWKFNGKRVDVGKPEDLFKAGQLLAKKPVKCVAFDADNTLYNTHQVSKFADLDAFKILGKTTGMGTGKIYDQWYKIVETVKDSKVPRERTRMYSYNLLLEKLSQDLAIASQMYEAFTKSLTTRIKPAYGIKVILKSLDQNKVIVTEDIRSLAKEKLKAVGLYNFFDRIITSTEIKIMKPSGKYYDYLLKKYSPEEILAVGDDWQKDLRIPQELGMQVLFIEKEQDLQKLKRIKLQKRIHIMGIAGAGAAAVAGIAKGYGYNVSGCDISPDSPYVKNIKIDIASGHSPNHLENIDMLVISPAVEKRDPKNLEIKKALKMKIPIMTWQKFQGEFLQKNKFTITVAGAYGKSTTTAMIAKIATDLNLDPTCEIGAKVLDWNANFRVGKSKYYVCESDEYNNNFLNYYPDVAVVLNVAWDHPDFFKTKEELFSSYQKFIENITKNGILIIAQGKKLQQLAKGARKDIKVVKVKDYGKTNLKIIGEFRQQNAEAALTVAEVLRLDIGKAKSSLASFTGVGSRLEYKGQIKGVKFYDDYAVQPYTILKTADALKAKYKNKKVLLVLEPHTFSRIETFFKDFTTSLKKSKVDRIYVTDVYVAREKGDKIALSRKLANAIGAKAKYTGSVGKTAKHIKKRIGNYNVICAMGAGDSYKLYDFVKQ